MKKTLLLSALVASAATFAGTTGSVEGFVNTSTDFVKDADHSGEISKSGLNYGSKFEVKVDNSGFSFGGTLHNKTSFNMFSNQLVDGYFNSKKSNVWAKYDLPEYKGIKSYVKGKVEALPHRDFNGTVEVNAEKEMNGVKVVFNNKTVFPFQKSMAFKENGKMYDFELLNKKVKSPTHYDADIVLYNYTINNTTKLSAEKDFDKIKELKGELELGTSATVKSTLHLPNVAISNDKAWKDKFYNKFNGMDVQDLSDARIKPGSKVVFNFNYLNANLSGKYVGVKDLEVTGEINGRYNHTDNLLSNKYVEKFDKVSDISSSLGGAFIVTKSIIDDFDFEDVISDFSKQGKFALSAKVDAEYKGIKDTTLTGGVQLIYNNFGMGNMVTPVLRAGVEYKGVKNLTLGAKGILVKPILIDHKLGTTLTYLNLNGKYDYKATDKLTISPEFKAEVKSVFNTNLNAHFIGLTPKVTAEYKANDNLVFEGNVSTTSYFVSAKVNNLSDSAYLGTTLRTGLNVKYTW